MRNLSVASCQLPVVNGQLRVASSPRTTNNGRRTNRAITLLEVLISIGVLAVGVMGAASLLPMATYYQNETTKYDRGGALAQQAVNDLQIKNYLSPRRWIFIDPMNPNAGSVTSWLGIADLFSVTNVAGNPTVYNPLSAFVLDPLGFSYVAAQSPAVPFPCYFPAFPLQGGGLPPGGGPSIYRAGITANDYWPPAATLPVESPIIMSFPVADRMMRSNDDLLFNTDQAVLLEQNPKNIDLRPTAIPFGAAAGINPSGTNVPNFAGDYSWIATVSRVPSDMVKGPAVAADLHRFQVSVVVLQKRDLTLWAGGLTPEQPPPERQVYAMFTQYGGQTGAITAPFAGGGGLQLYVYETGTPTPGQPSRNWLDNIKANTYLMLSAQFQEAVSGTVVYPQLAWYRIVNVDDGPNQDPNNSSRWYRNLTVTGSDWPAVWYQWTNGNAPTGATTQLWFGADPNAPNAMMPYATAVASAPTQVPVAFCTLMDDAVAAYDETITLDYSLMRQ
jgi:type II secretory pathway pseudopilin PulG